MMFELFRWGFVLAMLLTWIALGVGGLMLLIPTKSPARHQAAAIEQKQAA